MQPGNMAQIQRLPGPINATFAAVGIWLAATKINLSICQYGKIPQRSKASRGIDDDGRDGGKTGHEHSCHSITSVVDGKVSIAQA